QFTRVRDDELPENPLALDSVHAVLVTGATFSALSMRQVSALRDWALSGGRVIFTNPLDETTYEDRIRLFQRPGIDLRQTGVYHFGAGFVASTGSGEVIAPFWL